MSADIELPDDHPLIGQEHLLDTHAGHLEAYANVLADADPDEIAGAMVVLSTGEKTDTLPTVAADAPAKSVSWYLLAAHLSHVADSHDAPPAAVAKHAVHVLYDMWEEGQ